MKTRFPRDASIAIAALPLLLGSLPARGAAQPAPREDVDATAVKAAVHTFHDALAAGDSTRALALLHPDVRVFEGGEAVEAHGTETMVLLRSADGWRIRHIHWSSR